MLSAVSGHTIIRRELESARVALQDALYASDTEHKNVAVIRARLMELGNQQREHELALVRTRDILQEEESKLRATRSTAADNLRLLQMDLNKLQNEFKTKERAVADLVKYHKALEEEQNVRKRDAESHLANIHVELDEEQRKLHGCRNELRVGKLEVEQLTSRRKQLETELVTLADKVTAESSKLNVVEIESSRQIEFIGRQISEWEKKCRVAKELASEAESRHGVLRQEVDELRRQEAELQRTAEARRRTCDEEVALARQQVFCLFGE